MKLLAAGAIAVTAVIATGFSSHTSAVATIKPKMPPVLHRAPAPLAQISTPPALATPDDGLVLKRVLKIDHPMTHGEFVWDDAGVPAGPIVVTVDLAAQMMSVFRGGYEIGAAVILYGAPEKPTPLGTFAITQKDAHHRSNLYDAAMPYMMRLTNDGITIHGADVQWDAATNGCVGIPTPFAEKLFAQAKLGDRVIITNGKMLQGADTAPTT